MLTSRVAEFMVRQAYHERENGPCFVRPELRQESPRFRIGGPVEGQRQSSNGLQIQETSGPWECDHVPHGPSSCRRCSWPGCPRPTTEAPALRKTLSGLRYRCEDTERKTIDSRGGHRLVGIGHTKQADSEADTHVYLDNVGGQRYH